MKLRFLAAVLIAIPVFAQPRLAIDLSGEWRASTNPDPGLASPEVDDSQWAVLRLPLERGRGRADQLAWLRKTADLPSWADRSQLTLTLGPLRSTYVVYINGHLAAAVGSLQDRRTAQLFRIRTFPIPAAALGNGSRVQIAIRLGAAFGRPFALSVVDEGPYLLADRAVAPLESTGIAQLALRRQLFTPKLAASAVFAALAILVFFVWLGERRRLEILLLSFFLAAYAVDGAHTVLSISPDATPFDPGVPVLRLTQYARPMLLTSFSLVALGFRQWWPQLLMLAGWLVVLFTPGRVYNVSAHLAMALLACAAVALGVRKLAKAQAPAGKYFFVAVLFLPVLEQTIRAIRAFQSPVQQFVLWRGYYFDLGDLVVLPMSGAVLAAVLWQLAVDRRERLRLAGEFEAARILQRLLLPETGAVEGGSVQVQATYEPAQEVGGDFYQFHVRENGSCVVLAGDVSGKGLEAAMVASVAVGAFRNADSDSPARLLEGLNRALTGHGRSGFVTCCCARFDPDGHAVFANAGHPAPYWNGKELGLEAGLPLGVAPGVTYAESTASLRAGDQVTFVSDGIVEAANAKGELFGFERTREISGKSAGEIANVAKAWGQNDDITVVTVRRVG